MEKELITLANKVAKESFMDYPDYDEDVPITTLAEAITLWIDSSLPHDTDIESDVLYDFINSKIWKRDLLRVN